MSSLSTVRRAPGLPEPEMVPSFLEELIRERIPMFPSCVSFRLLLRSSRPYQTFQESGLSAHRFFPRDLFFLDFVKVSEGTDLK